MQFHVLASVASCYFAVVVPRTKCFPVDRRAGAEGAREERGPPSGDRSRQRDRSPHAGKRRDDHPGDKERSRGASPSGRPSRQEPTS